MRRSTATPQRQLLGRPMRMPTLSFITAVPPIQSTLATVRQTLSATLP